MNCTLKNVFMNIEQLDALVIKELLHQTFSERDFADDIESTEDDVMESTIRLSISQCAACSQWHYESDMSENACDLFCEHCISEEVSDGY